MEKTKTTKFLGSFSLSKNGGGGGGLTPSITWYTGNIGTTVTILDTSSYNYVEVYKNGVLLQETADYSISETTLTLQTALDSADKIAIKVNSLSSADLNAIENKLSGI